MIKPLLGRPQVGAELQVTHRIVLRQGFWTFLANGVLVDGAKTRDPGNTGDTRCVRAGTLMGKDSTNGRYAPSVIGALTGSATATATSVTLSLAAAAELVRRVGPTGTLRFVGPPTAAGTVATFTETYSAVDLATGAVTCSALDAALVSGSFVCANDGTHVPRTVVPCGHGFAIPEDSSHVEWPLVPVGGAIDSPQLLPWPADASLRTWVQTSLSTLTGGKFTFTDTF